jgi:hypothetical protein
MFATRQEGGRQWLAQSYSARWISKGACSRICQCDAVKYQSKNISQNIFTTFLPIHSMGAYRLPISKTG